MDNSNNSPKNHLNLDLEREVRCGIAEVVFAENKTPQQVADACVGLANAHGRVLATRANEVQANAVINALPNAIWDEESACIYWHKEPPVAINKTVAVLMAGTSDLSVASEAKVTLEFFGIKANLISDVGVAGIHRLFKRIEEFRDADVVIVCAGMEGALPSVVAGLTDKAVIAVPTSVGYGASFDGLAALLAMLNSCSPGIGVVNIDNGFGAAVLARKIIG